MGIMRSRRMGLSPRPQNNREAQTEIHIMKLDYSSLELALQSHAWPEKAPRKKTRAKDVRANNRNRPTKVKKATKLNVCTLGGTLPNRHNDSGRSRISSRDIDEVMNDLISDDPEYSIY